MEVERKCTPEASESVDKFDFFLVPPIIDQKTYFDKTTQTAQYQKHVWYNEGVALG